jgi:hypothetical protein
LLISPSLACGARVRHRLLQRPTVVNRKCLRAFHDGPHLVDGGHNSVLVAGANGGGEVEEDDFGGADFSVGAESGRWVVGGAERDVQRCDGFFVVDDGSQVPEVGFIVAFRWA